MTTWRKWGQGDKPFQNFVQRSIKCSFWVSVQWTAITIVAQIVYYSFHSVFLSGQMSGVLETVGRCAGLFYCSTGLEESKKLERGARDILARHFGINEFICLCIRSGISNITVDCLKDFWCSSTSDGYILESCFFLLTFSNHINNAFSASHGISCHVIISCSPLSCLELRVAKMSQGIWSCFPNRSNRTSRDNKISFQSKNDIVKQSL